MKLILTFAAIACFSTGAYAYTSAEAHRVCKGVYYDYKTKEFLCKNAKLAVTNNQNDGPGVESAAARVGANTPADLPAVAKRTPKQP